MYPIGTAVWIEYTDGLKGGIVVGYGISHAQSLIDRHKTPESVYLVELAVPIHWEQGLITQTVVESERISINAVCECCGVVIDESKAVMSRNFVYDMNVTIHYVDGVYWTCLDCSK